LLFSQFIRIESFLKEPFQILKEWMKVF
jgi:hypothetical protein